MIKKTKKPYRQKISTKKNFFFFYKLIIFNKKKMCLKKSDFKIRKFLLKKKKNLFGFKIKF